VIAHGKDIKVFAGNANLELAKGICRKLNLNLGQSHAGSFSDGEIAITIDEPVRGSDVFIVQPTCAPVNNNLMELLIMIDALRRASAGRITAVMPYFGYGRQDRKARSRDPISAKLVANLITTAGADRVLTMDLHAPQIQGFFDIPVDNLLGANIFAEYFKKRFADILGDGKNELIAVSPDVGSVSRVRKFSHLIGVNLAIVDKRREEANKSEVMNIIGDVAGKTVLLLDDMVDTAGSLCNAAEALMDIGGAKEIYACASHGVLSGRALDRINSSCIKELMLLDTIPYPASQPCEKIKYLPVDELFARAISRIYEEEPLSSLFD